MHRIVTVFLLVASIAGMGLMAQQSSSAQEPSLGELARKEKERRAGLTKKAPVITNADLKRFGGAVSQSQVPPDPATTAAVAADTKPAAEGEQKPTEGGAAQQKNEAYYAPLFQEARLNLKTLINNDLVTQLKMNELRNRFFVEADGSTRGLIEQEIATQVQQIETGKIAIEVARQALDKLVQQAKADGLPLAWISSQSEMIIEPPVAPAAAPIPPPLS
ncbi:MAG: hypothetical protein ACR2L2_02300 [Acidobacteriota bacterium]